MEVLRLEPNKKTELVSLTSLNYLEADGTTDLDEKLRRFDDAASWYEKTAGRGPSAKECLLFAWSDRLEEMASRLVTCPRAVRHEAR